MCIGCDWARYRNFLFDSPAEAGRGLTRRQALLGGATLAASAVVASAMPSFKAEAATPSDGSADVVFRNGPVYTVNAEQPWARAVAVKGRHILFVGDEPGVEAFIGPETRVVDLAGKMLLPGFIEGHIHPIVGTITRGIDLQLDSREEVLDALKAYRSTIGSVDIVRGFGWRYNAFPSSGPRREDLDAIWPDTPVFLIAIDGHSGWVNSKALELSAKGKAGNVDPLPGFSYFQRDAATGEPTGWLIEPPVMFQVMNAVGPFTADYVAQSVREWLPKASAAGITSIFDAGTVLVPEDDAFDFYSDLERQGKLPLRIVGSLYYNNPSYDPVPRILALRDRFNSELIQARMLKLNIDGGEPQHTAALLEPYSDRPGFSGDTLLPPDLFKEIVRRADFEGIDMHIHTFGDRAIRLSLDALEGAIKANPPRDRRHAIAHLPLVSQQDVPRLGELGVVAQFSAQWSVRDHYWESVSKSRLGPVRAEQLYRLGSVLQSGGTLALGTDWPAANYYSTFRPLDAIEIAVTRRPLNMPEVEPLPPADERIPLADALRANTMGSAYQLGLEKTTGSIEAGKFADLVLLEKNLFDIAPEDIHKTRVVMTMMNGRVTHEQAA